MRESSLIQQVAWMMKLGPKMFWIFGGGPTILLDPTNLQIQQIFGSNLFLDASTF